MNRNVYRQLLDECKYNLFYWSKLLKTETVYEILKYPGITETLYIYILKQFFCLIEQLELAGSEKPVDTWEHDILL